MSEPSVADPGLGATVPFRFQCHRCGHCCTGGQGYVWVEEEELGPMARRLGMSVEAFTRTHVRTVSDPETGGMRLSLRERAEGGSGGSCSLLEGSNRCTVYADRPRHCRTFPYWPTVLSDRDAFERARERCPGIAVDVPVDVRRVAFAALEQLYAEVDAFVQRARPVCILRGGCCRFEEAGHELFATPLEADYAAARHPRAADTSGAPGGAPGAASASGGAGSCPYHVRGRCEAREGRPLGCRTYFCDRRTESVLREAHEHFLRELRRIERDTGYPAGYARFPALLAGRGITATP